YRTLSLLGTQVPVVRGAARRTLDGVASAIEHGLVRACHDLSEGGLAVAAAEMAFSGVLGVEIALARVPSHVARSDRRLFSESTTRFLVEVEPSRAAAFARHLASRGVVAAEIGRVVDVPRLVIRSVEDDRDVVSAPIDELATAWRSPLRFGHEEA